MGDRQIFFDNAAIGMRAAYRRVHGRCIRLCREPVFRSYA
jgi:hypothetical protein